VEVERFQAAGSSIQVFLLTTQVRHDRLYSNPAGVWGLHIRACIVHLCISNNMSQMGRNQVDSNIVRIWVTHGGPAWGGQAEVERFQAAGSNIPVFLLTTQVCHDMTGTMDVLWNFYIDLHFREMQLLLCMFKQNVSG
jgi:hypothetical protein